MGIETAIIAASIGAAGSLAGGAISSSGAQNAANTQANAQLQATRESNDLQKYMYDQNRTDLAPWREAGTQALGTLSGMANDMNKPFTMADFMADPGYAFRQSEGIKGLERGAAARGNLLSGAEQKGLLGFNSDLASQEFNNAFSRYQTDNSARFNRLAALAGIGQQATNQTVASGNNYANNASNILFQGLSNAGSARASGYVGSANSWANALNGATGNIGQALTMSQLMQRFGQPAIAGAGINNAYNSWLGSNMNYQSPGTSILGNNPAAGGDSGWL